MNCGTPTKEITIHEVRMPEKEERGMKEYLKQ